MLDSSRVSVPGSVSSSTTSTHRSDGDVLQALGCLWYYTMYGKLAFGAEAKLQILNGDFSISGNRPPAFVALLRELLVTQPARRPGQLASPQQLHA